MTNQKKPIERRELNETVPVLDNTASFASAGLTTEPTSKSKANFICFNTTNIRGTRINLDTLESYAPNGDLSIQLGRSTGRISLDFSNKEERDIVLARLDSYCL